ncbi:MAG: Replicative DNA helicase [Syntrophorhabdus sp. PtaU1.Bin153]|nr:MAG: Replicative DNA helicase [Syntrophorhabdus sp. PtaU1.Bin153]
MIETALTELQIAYKVSSGQIVVDCPYCGKSNHLYIDPQKGVYYCHKCGERGGWSKLRKQLGAPGDARVPGSAPTVIVPASPAKLQYRHPSDGYTSGCRKRLLGPSGTSVINYLYERKISLDAIHHFGLGLENRDGKEWLVIPYMKNGEPVNIKYRTLPPSAKEFRRWRDGESILFHRDCLKTLKDDDPVIIAEGETDCLTLFSAGFHSVVATSIGAGGIKPEWIDELERFSTIYIAYDSDDAGRKGAKELAMRLGDDRCRNVQLPAGIDDVNDFFMKGGTREEFESLIGNAKPLDVENILDIEQAFKRLIDSYNDEQDGAGILPPWNNVAKLTGAFEPGDLIILSATPKTGKTTLALNISLNISKKGLPTLLYCLEMRPERLVKKTMQIQGWKREDELTPDAMVNLYRQLDEVPLYFGYNYRKCTLDIVVETIRKGVRRYGFKFVVFDNLHFLARDISHQTQEVGMISKTFKLLAEELQIPIMLIAQPRKVDDNQVMGMNDLKDSSSIGADADMVIVLYRKKTKNNDGTAETSFDPTTLVRVDASRFKSGGEALLYYDGARAVFKELAVYSGNA